MPKWLSNLMISLNLAFTKDNKEQYLIINLYLRLGEGKISKNSLNGLIFEALRNYRYIRSKVFHIFKELFMLIEHLSKQIVENSL